MAEGNRQFDNGVPQPIKNSSLNGAIPTVWDPGWQFFTDLSKEQIAAFQAMPEWKAYVADHAAWEKSKIGGAPSLTILAIKALQAAASNKVK